MNTKKQNMNTKKQNYELLNTKKRIIKKTKNKI